MYKKLIIDADTPLLAAAAMVQENYVIVTNKRTGVSKEYRNHTEFWGHHAKKQGGWLRDINAFLGTGFEADDFSIEECARPSPEIDEHIEAAKRNFDYFVGSMKKLNIAEEYLLVIGGEGNFRYDLARLQPYKGQRKDKPLFFAELKEQVVEQYKNKIKVVDGIEADDYLSILGMKNYLRYLKKGEWENILAYCDKDLDMIISPSINYKNLEEGVRIPTPEQATLAYVIQLLTGDKETDNIPGLPNFTAEIQEKYALGKTRGIGKATALRFLEGAESSKELFERVCEAYRGYYSEPVTFTDFRGQEQTWDWLEFLNESARLLYLLRKEGEEYHITHTLDKLGVNYSVN